jgi:GABA(A) receptor-associated protein
MSIVFKDEYTLEKRCEESRKIRGKYPDRVPVIVENDKNSSMFSTTLPTLDKKKYLVPLDISISQFMIIIRKRLKLDEKKGFFLIFENNTMATGTDTMGNMYEANKNEDGFLYINLCAENTFG